MKPLEGKVAIAAGGSRGAGRGIALALGDAGATVYVAARTSRSGPKPADGAPGTIEDSAEEVTARGGQGVPLRVDLSNEEQAGALFRRVEEEQAQLAVAAHKSEELSPWGRSYEHRSKSGRRGPDRRCCDKSSSIRGLVKARHRFGFVAENLENGVQARDPQNIRHSFLGVQQFQIASDLFDELITADQLAETRGAVHVSDVREVQ